MAISTCFSIYLIAPRPNSQSVVWHLNRSIFVECTLVFHLLLLYVSIDLRSPSVLKLGNVLVVTWMITQMQRPMPLYYIPVIFGWACVFWFPLVANTGLMLGFMIYCGIACHVSALRIYHTFTTSRRLCRDFGTEDTQEWVLSRDYETYFICCISWQICMLILELLNTSSFSRFYLWGIFGGLIWSNIKFSGNARTIFAF